MLNPDRIMLLSFNLGKLVESPDVEEKDLGMALALYFLNQTSLILSDLFQNEQIVARDTILKRQSAIIFECIQEIDETGELKADIDLRMINYNQAAAMRA